MTSFILLVITIYAAILSRNEKLSEKMFRCHMTAYCDWLLPFKFRHFVMLYFQIGSCQCFKCLNYLTFLEGKSNPVCIAGGGSGGLENQALLTINNTLHLKCKFITLSSIPSCFTGYSLQSFKKVLLKKILTWIGLQLTFCFLDNIVMTYSYFNLYLFYFKIRVTEQASERCSNLLCSGSLHKYLDNQSK